MSVSASVPRNGRADNENRHKPSARPHDPLLAGYRWMCNDGSDLISPKPAANDKEKDRQAEANDQERNINSAEYLLNK